MISIIDKLFFFVNNELLLFFGVFLRLGMVWKIISIVILLLYSWLHSVSVASQAGGYEFSGYACNVVHTPNADKIWSIHLYNTDKSLTESETVYGVSQNRKIQSVACTPDGSYLLFSMKETSQGDYEVYSLELETRVLKKLTDNDGDDVDVTLSADGLIMAWQERLSDNRQAIVLRTYHVGRESYELVNLASANPFIQPSLSANGKWLALVQLRVNNFIALRYDVETEDFLSVVTIPRRQRINHPSVSNDGNVYGWLQGKKQNRYFISHIDSGIRTRVLVDPEGIYHPFISPDGEWVGYSLNNDTTRTEKLTNISSNFTVTLGNEVDSSARHMAGYWIGVAEEIDLSAITGKLNDTGFTQCQGNGSHSLSCPVIGYPRQDAQFGRDVTDNYPFDGHAGFSFTKLDENGKELLPIAANWSCVRDNVTGLIWEVKQRQGLHSAFNLYNWYTTDTSNDGGFSGPEDGNGNICHSYSAGNAASYCNTEAYTKRVNEQGLCGYWDWRLPSREELQSIVNYDVRYSDATIDKDFFPNTIDSLYWSSSPAPGASDYAYYVYFARGNASRKEKSSYMYVRLVRGEQQL